MNKIFDIDEDFLKRNSIVFPKKVALCTTCLLTNKKMVSSQQFLDYKDILV